MKKIMGLITIGLLAFACTPRTAKSTAGAAGPENMPASGPTEAHLAAAKKKFPDVTMEVLKKGHAIYYGACTHCHGAKNIVNRDEKEWSGVLNEMAPKAQLGKEEKEAVWKYIMAVKLS